MPIQRGGKPRNQAGIDAFQSIILPNRIVPAVKCLYCHLQMAFGTSRMIVDSEVAMEHPNN